MSGMTWSHIFLLLTFRKQKTETEMRITSVSGEKRQKHHVKWWWCDNVGSFELQWTQWSPRWLQDTLHYCSKSLFYNFSKQQPCRMLPRFVRKCTFPAAQCAAGTSQHSFTLTSLCWNIHFTVCAALGSTAALEYLILHGWKKHQAGARWKNPNCLQGSRHMKKIKRVGATCCKGYSPFML